MNLIFYLVKELFVYKDNQYGVLTNIVRMLLYRLAPIKSKKISGNDTLFMPKELSIAIMNKSKLRNRYTKWPSCENLLAFKKQ